MRISVPATDCIDHARFRRVHRSHVVNLGFISALESRDGSRLTIVLASGARIPASRSGSAQLRKAELKIEN